MGVGQYAARKHRRQTYIAAIASTDTLVGEFRATRPILKLYCHNNVRELSLEIWVGQHISGSLPCLRTGSDVGYTALRIQRDSMPEQEATWMYALHDEVTGPKTSQRSETIKELSAASRYRIGVMIYNVGQRYMTFDLTHAAERIAWVADHCGVKYED